jgi:hypothetical protein
VARAWLRQALPAAVGVDFRLPPESEVTPEVRANGFVVIQGVVGGSPDIDVPLRQPVIGVRAWMPPTAATSQPQWNAADQLADSIVRAAYDVPPQGVRLDMAAIGLAAFRPAWVRSAYLLGEPREIYDDPGNYAGFDLDLQLNWTEN